jgi:hypothetical protein
VVMMSGEKLFSFAHLTSFLGCLFFNFSILALTSNLGSLFIFAKSTFYLGWQKKNFLSWRSVICIFKKSGRGPL